MSKEAEEFFRQKTIENAKRPRMKKFLALVNREAEGKILQEYADQQLILSGVSQQSELYCFECEIEMPTKVDNKSVLRCGNCGLKH